MSHLTEFLTGTEANQIDNEIAEKIDRNLARKDLEKSELIAENDMLKKELETQRSSQIVHPSGEENMEVDTVQSSSLPTKTEDILTKIDPSPPLSYSIAAPKVLQFDQVSNAGSGSKMSIADPLILNDNKSGFNTPGGHSNLDMLPESPYTDDIFIKYKNLQNALDNKKLENTNLTCEISSLKTEQQCLNISLKQKDNEISTLILEFDKIKEQLNTSRQQNKQYLDENSKLNANDIHNKYEIKKLERQNNSLESKIRDLDYNLSVLTDTKSKERSEINNERENFRIKIDKFESSMNSKDREIESLNKELEKLQEELKNSLDRNEEKEENYASMKLAKEKQISAFEKVIESYKVELNNQEERINQLLATSKQLEAHGDEVTAEKVKLKTKITWLEKQNSELTTERDEFKLEIENCNKILSQMESLPAEGNFSNPATNPSLVDESDLLNDPESLAPVAARTAKLVKNKTLTEIFSELHDQIQKNDDQSQIIESLELNLEELTKKVAKFRPYAKNLQSEVSRLENENAELVSQLDLSHRDVMSYRTQSDDLLLENQKLKRVVKRRENETCNLTDQIAKYIHLRNERHERSSMNVSGNLSSHPISLDASHLTNSNTEPDMSIFDIQKVLSEKINLERRIDDYQDKLNELLQAAQDDDKLMELEKELNDNKSNLNIITNDRDNLQTEVNHLKKQLNAYSEIISGKEGETYESALSFRDQTLDYKNKFLNAESEIVNLKNCFEEERKELRLLNDDLRNELVNCKVKIESANSMASINDDRVELAEREVTRMRREINQLHVKMETFRNENLSHKENYSNIKNENRNLNERLQIYESSNHQLENQVKLMEMNEANYKQQLMEKQELLISNGAIWNKINELDDKNSIQNKLEISKLEEKIKDLEFTRDQRIKSSQDFIKDSQDMMADLRHQLKNKDIELSDVKKEYILKEKDIRAKYETEFNEFKRKHQTFRKEIFDIETGNNFKLSGNANKALDEILNFSHDKENSEATLEEQINTLLIQSKKERSAIIKLKSDNERLNKKNGEIQSISKMSEDRLNAITKEMDVLQHNITLQNEKNRKEISDLMELNMHLKTVNSSLEREKEDNLLGNDNKVTLLETKIKELETHLTQSNQNNTKKDELLDTYKTDLNQLKDKLTENDQTNTNLNQQINLLNHQFNELNDRNFTLETDIKLLKRKEKDYETEISKLEATINHERTEHKNVLDDIESTKNLVKQQNDIMHEKMKNDVEKVKNLEEKVAMLVKNGGKLVEDTEAVNATAGNANTSMTDDINTSITSVNTEIINAAGEKSEELLKLIETQRREKQRIEIRLENVIKAERRKTIELEQIQQSEKNYKSQSSQYQNKLKIILGMVGDEKQARNLLETNKLHEKTVAEQLKKINEIEAQVVNLTNEIASKDDFVKSLEKDLSEKSKELSKLEGKYDHARDRFKEKSANNKELKKEKEALENERKELVLKIKNFQEKNKADLEEFKKLREENANLKTNTSNQELLKSQKELAVVADKFERLKNLGRRQRDDIKERDAKIASLQAEKEELIKKAEESTAELGAATGLQSGAGSSVETQIKLNMLTKKIKALEEEKQQLKTKLVMLEKSNAVLSEYSITFKIDENLLKEYPLTLAHDDNTALPQFIKKNERMQNLIHKLKIVRKTLGAAEQRNAELSLKIEQLEKKMVQLKNKESDTVASMTSVPESVKPVIGVAPNNARNIAEENVENVGEREVKADGLSTGAKRPRDITPNSKQPADKRRRELDDKPTATVAPVVQVKEPTPMAIVQPLQAEPQRTQEPEIAQPARRLIRRPRTSIPRNTEPLPSSSTLLNLEQEQVQNQPEVTPISEVIQEVTPVPAEDLESRTLVVEDNIEDMEMKEAMKEDADDMLGDILENSQDQEVFQEQVQEPEVLDMTEEPVMRSTSKTPVAQEADELDFDMEEEADVMLDEIKKTEEIIQKAETARKMDSDDDLDDDFDDDLDDGDRREVVPLNQTDSAAANDATADANIVSISTSVEPEKVETISGDKPIESSEADNLRDALLAAMLKKKASEEDDLLNEMEAVDEVEEPHRVVTRSTTRRSSGRGKTANRDFEYSTNENSSQNEGVEEGEIADDTDSNPRPVPIKRLLIRKPKNESSGSGGSAGAGSSGNDLVPPTSKEVLEQRKKDRAARFAAEE